MEIERSVPWICREALRVIEAGTPPIRGDIWAYTVATHTVGIGIACFGSQLQSLSGDILVKVLLGLINLSALFKLGERQV